MSHSGKELVAKDSHDLAYESKSYKYVFFYSRFQLPAESV